MVTQGKAATRKTMLHFSFHYCSLPIIFIRRVNKIVFKVSCAGADVSLSPLK
jgi:hypothetical protein